MEINDAKVLAEVAAGFARYEGALICNDVVTLTGLFWDSSLTFRYGIVENLHGGDEVTAFRAARSPVGLARSLSRTVITTYGDDIAAASTLFHRDTMAGKIGCQMQSWARQPEGWRIVAVDVGLIDAA